MSPKTKIIAAVSPDHLQQIESLAQIIWREHYIPIIGSDQVEYMLDKYQTASAMEEQIEDGYGYFLVLNGEEAIGYFSVKKEGKELFLSKVYVLSLFRGQGHGHACFSYIEEYARQYGCERIRLTVNKFNSLAIMTYEGLGFNRVDSIVMDIGGGFVMDDYVYVKEVI